MNALVGRNIEQLRKRRGLSQQELADLVEMHQTAISKFELGERRISVDALEKIAAALGVQSADLLPAKADAPAPVAA